MLLGKLLAAAKSIALAESITRVFQMLSVAFDALVTGSRSIPMGDNVRLFRELRERTGRPSEGAR